MNSSDTLIKLASLEREEAYVLFWKLRGETHSQIGLRMGLSGDRVQQHSTALYKAFGIEGGRWEQLKRLVQTPMLTYAQPKIWKEWDWPTRELTARIAQAYVPPTQPPSEPQPISPVPIYLPPEPSWFDTFRQKIIEIANNRRNQLIAFLVVVIGCIILFSNLPSRSFSPAPTPTVTKPVETGVVVEMTPAIVNTPTPKPTITRTPTATYTKRPSSTPRPPTVTITPEDVLFYHDMNKGISGLDIAEPNEVTLTNGMYRGSWFTVPLDAKNFQIDVNGQGGIMIAPAYIDVDNMVYFLADARSQGWYLCKTKGGCGEIDTGERDHGYSEGIFYVRIKVVDGNMTVRVNGRNHADLYNNKVPFGLVGFNAYGGGIKDVKIISLP